MLPTGFATQTKLLETLKKNRRVFMGSDPDPDGKLELCYPAALLIRQLQASLPNLYLASHEAGIAPEKLDLLLMACNTKIRKEK